MTCSACDPRVRELYAAARAVGEALALGSVGRVTTAHDQLRLAADKLEPTVESHELEPCRPEGAS